MSVTTGGANDMAERTTGAQPEAAGAVSGSANVRDRLTTGTSGRLFRIGAVLYVLWGIVHVVVAALPLITRVTSGPTEMFAFAELIIEPERIDAAWLHVANLIAEFYFDIGALGILAIMVAVGMIWKGDPFGFWINFVVLGIADAAFFFLEIVPGYQPPTGPLLAVLVYVFASAFCAAGLIRARRAMPSGSSTDGGTA